ncbi:translocation/assembly module TamB domain-containing protein [Methylomonas sp. SURF-2]|uniref:Translocation/assembly module TamB domain-containing protein n=1 Tax=Methylomonas subterranea TaxID=2952225 RepID=A0ABT1TC40_9GAMM|nr:translocation/assembly module TamB domain-containing protein [Methylomonas sp. SURF-2]MCQ8102811.1 translocation/assembly module TamB domain-containing protein [Methylomonas sp. SURF-2]
MKKTLLLLALALMLLLPVGLYSLLNSSAGSRWLLQGILAALPAQTGLARIEGRLLDQIELQGLHYETDAEAVDIDRLRFSWQPAHLLTGTLKLVDISLEGVTIVVKQPRPSSEGGFDWEAELGLPLQVILENLSVTDLYYRAGETDVHLQYLRLSALSERNRIDIPALSLRAAPLELELSGQVALGRGFPFSLSSEWRFDSPEYGRWQTHTRVSGNADYVELDSRQQAPFPLSVHGTLKQLQTQAMLALRGDWQQLRWPPNAATPQFGSDRGFFEIDGVLDDYRVRVAGPLTQDYLPDARLEFSGQGSGKTLQIADLQLSSPAGGLFASGNVAWETGVQLDLRAGGKNFNPALFLADLPGKLSFDSHIQAKIDAGASEARITLASLTGQLRGNPVRAGGKISYTDRGLAIDHLAIHAGRNRIGANGRMAGGDSDLSFDIDSPDMAGLWPGLSGALKASGRARGKLQNPQLAFQAQGRRLRLADHAIGRLDMNVDYRPEAGQVSKIQLRADNIQTAGIALDRLTLDGAGNLSRHRLTLDMHGPSLSLAGAVSAGARGPDWQAHLNTLDLSGPAWGQWRLPAPSQIKASRAGDGFDISMTDICLKQNNASLCLGGRYRSDSDFSAQLRARTLPAALLNAYLPAGVSLNSRIEADIDLKRRNGVLTGSYRLDMPDDGKLLVERGQNVGELNLGAIGLSGQLDDQRLQSRADIRLPDGDFFRAALQYNIDSQRIQSGHIAASVKHWAWLQPFAAQLAQPTGQLKADLTLSGNPRAPNISGGLELTGGSFELPDAGVGFRELDLQASAGDGKSKNIAIRGTARPFFVRNDAPAGLQFNGRLELAANLQRLQPLTGDYRIGIPAGVSIGHASGPTMPIAASSLSGAVQGDQLSAQLDLRLPNDDYVSALLRADSGPGQSLSGQINASWRDMTLIDALLADLSQTQGHLKADLTLAGSLSQPQLAGSVNLLQAAATINALGIRIQDLNLRAANADSAADRLQISGGARSGQGRLSLSGSVGLNGAADLALRGEDFEAAKLAEAQVTISPDLRLTSTQSGEKLSGRLDIPKAIIALREIPEHAVSVSEDETILGQARREQTSPAEFGPDADIEVVLGRQVHFTGMGLDSGLAGRLKIQRSGGATQMHGTVDMQQGRYQSYGQDLSLRKGRFLFNGPLAAPWLDVEAVRLSRDHGVTAVLQLSGPLNTPKTRVYSEPALPEADALAYLVTGSPLNQVGKGNANLLASAAVSYGAGQLSWLSDKLGVDEFEVKQGQTLQDTLLTVGQYLSPDFYVGTRVGIFNQQATLVLKHKLSKTINLETQAGTSQRVKLNYEIDTD